jgi:hypothetical protein
MFVLLLYKYFRKYIAMQELHICTYINDKIRIMKTYYLPIVSFALIYVYMDIVQREGILIFLVRICRTTSMFLSCNLLLYKIVLYLCCQ